MAAPKIILPRWTPTESGLLVPTSVQPRHRLPPGAIPAEVLPPNRPVAIRGNPGSAAPILVYADEAKAKLPRTSLDTLRSWARLLPFEPAMSGIASLAARVYGFRGDSAAHARLARDTFGEGTDVYRNLMAFLAEDSDRHVIFSEQHLFILQRVLIDEARDVGQRHLTPAEAQLLSRALLGATGLTAETADEQIAAEPVPEKWLPFFIQNGAYNTTPAPIGELGRAQKVFGEIAAAPKALASKNFCPLDHWMVEDYGLSIPEQLTLGFALGAMTHALMDQEVDKAYCFVSAKNLADLFATLGWSNDKVSAALSVIATDRETYRQGFTARGTSAQAVTWDILPVMTHPFLRSSGGGIVLLSTRALLSWLSDGFHYRLLDSARRRSKAQGSTRISRDYLAFVGELFEDYALDLARSVHPGNRPPGGGRVFGEQRYGKKGSQKTSDVAVDLGADLVLFEVCSSRFRADTLLEADEKHINDDLGRAITSKINQLSNCVDALASGAARISADGGEDAVTYSDVARVWPVLVSASGVTQTPPFWQHLRTTIPAALKQAKVQPLTILDFEDFEVLMFLVEQGHALNDLLERKTLPRFRDVELAIWLQDDHGAPRSDIGRPKMLTGAYGAAMDQVYKMLGYDPPSPGPRFRQAA